MPRTKKLERGKGGAGTQSYQLAQQLEEKIFSGQLRPGEKLDEVTIASEFGVSRTPVREAIQRLVATGMVEVPT